MDHAKLFKTGGSQAVRLPREFRFRGTAVRIWRAGGRVILEPLEASRGRRDIGEDEVREPGRPESAAVGLPRELVAELSALATIRGETVAALVRRACEAQFRLPSAEDRLAAVDALEALRLPVAALRQMKRQSVPAPEDLLP